MKKERKLVKVVITFTYDDGFESKLGYGGRNMDLRAEGLESLAYAPLDVLDLEATRDCVDTYKTLNLKVEEIMKEVE